MPNGQNRASRRGKVHSSPASTLRASSPRHSEAAGSAEMPLPIDPRLEAQTCHGLPLASKAPELHAAIKAEPLTKVNANFLRMVMRLVQERGHAKIPTEPSRAPASLSRPCLDVAKAYFAALSLVRHTDEKGPTARPTTGGKALVSGHHGTGGKSPARRSRLWKGRAKLYPCCFGLESASRGLIAKSGSILAHLLHIAAEGVGHLFSCYDEF